MQTECQWRSKFALRSMENHNLIFSLSTTEKFPTKVCRDLPYKVPPKALKINFKT